MKPLGFIASSGQAAAVPLALLPLPHLCPRPQDMAYDPPRPYRPQELKSPDVRSLPSSTPRARSTCPCPAHSQPFPGPQSYDSLRPPPSVTQWSNASGSGYSSAAGSSVALGGSSVSGPPQGGAGAGAQLLHAHAGGGADRGGGPPPAHPAMLQKKERGPKHEVLELGGCVSSLSQRRVLRAER